MKRGQTPVVPFFRVGEGDGTFNGFVLSNQGILKATVSGVFGDLKFISEGSDQN